MTKPETLEEQCARKGMRMTDQRRVIAQVIEAASDHPDVEELYRRASSIDARISLSTVYRTLNMFEEAGLVTKHDFKDGRARIATTANPANPRNGSWRHDRAHSV